MAGAHPSQRFEFSGGRLCLDFANTVSWRGRPGPVDQLRDYDDWLAWSLEAGLAAPAQARKLKRQARAHPAWAEAALRQARAVRERIFAVFSAIAAKQAPPAPAVAAVNRALLRAMAGPRIAASRHGFVWQWQPRDDELAAPLWPVVRSVAELLTTPAELARVRECAAAECGWLFLDTSRNKLRRWCDMRVCGNRDKARRFYRRQRQG